MKSEMRVASPPEIPVLIFDGDCGFCRRWILRWQSITGDRVEYRASADEEIGRCFPEIPRAWFDESVVFVDTDGKVVRGAEAVWMSLSRARGYGWLTGLYRKLPGFAALSEAAYGLVARRRTMFSWLTRVFLGAEPAGYASVRLLFLRLLGLVYLLAFWSLWAQIDGLIGSNGITPAENVIEAAGQQVSGIERWFRLPTLCWLGTGDGFLSFQCALGMAAAVVLILGVLPVPMLMLMWLLYLSLTTVSGVFLGFQWDNLLLETGLLAIFFAPFAVKSGGWRRLAPAFLSVWLLRWLLFRLMIESGMVKLMSGDTTWRDLTALTYHYETQPLPTWVGWYFHQLPVWLHKASALVMFGIELVVPFMALGPRRARLWAFPLLAAFQVLIALTGNYGIFNLLTFVLCLALLDDRALGGVAKLARRIGRPGEAAKGAGVREAASGAAGVARPVTGMAGARNWPGWVLGPFAAFVVFITGIQLVALVVPIRSLIWPVNVLYTWQQPFRSLNQYGLFAVMTLNRPEIVVEGSANGLEWRRYVFRYKVDDPGDRPRFVAPHMPRLDWQMWFAALGDYRRSPWFVNFCVRLLEGRPEVLSLLEENPFPDGPPRYIRARLYEYRFTDRETRRETGQWWTREYAGPYLPEFSLEEVQPR